MLKNHPVRVALALVLLFAASFLFPFYGEICEPGNQHNNAKNEECSTYHITLVALWHVVKALNDWSGVVAALATVAIAGFTWVLWVVTGGTLKLARQEFAATHRPKLRVRNVVVEFPEGESQDWRIQLLNKQEIKGHFMVTNFGGTLASVAAARCDVFWSANGLPMRRPYEGLPPKYIDGVTGQTIHAGISVEGHFTSEHPTDYDQAFDLSAGDPCLYVMGWISYTNNVGLGPWRTDFCRIYSVNDKYAPRFVCVDNEDYEHEG